MRRAALALLASGSILLAAAPAFAAFGAIAIDTHAHKFGWSRDQATPERAEQVALSRCGTSGCKVVVRFGAKRCGALATARHGQGVGAAARKTPDQARLAALADCKKGHAGECVIRATPCNR